MTHNIILRIQKKKYSLCTFSENTDILWFNPKFLPVFWFLPEALRRTDDPEAAANTTEEEE